jgi:CRISPR-associated protein Csd1
LKTKLPQVEAVEKFYINNNITELPLPKDFDPGDELVFRVQLKSGERVYPTDSAEVKQFWSELLTPQDKGKDSQTMTCMICGQEKTPIESHPVLIKRIPGGQSTGMAIISANSAAFESYGLKRSTIAPTCFECAEKYGKNLNTLIENQNNSLSVGGSRFVFWTKSGSAFSPLSFLREPEALPEEVKSLINSFKHGNSQDLKLDEDAFYSVSLSASGARVVVRDWLETTVGNVKQNLARWFRLQSLVDFNGEEIQPMGLFKLAVSLYREGKDISPNIPRWLLTSALQGKPLSMDLLFLAVKRNRAEQALTKPRAVLIKMVYVSNFGNKGKENYMSRLETQETNPAYLCGRLLAELEALQRSALGDIKATITDRFFGTASSAPASVFGRLMRGAQMHLGKLRKEKPNAYIAIQKRLEEIQSGLGAFPKTLSLQDQGLFSLGYYHQRTENRISIEKNKKEKENSKTGQEA